MDVHDPAENRAKLKTLMKLVIKMLLHKWHEVSSLSGQLLASHRDYVAWLLVSHSFSQSVNQPLSQAAVSKSVGQLTRKSISRSISQSVR